jgi:hypothetical protein
MFQMVQVVSIDEVPINFGLACDSLIEVRATGKLDKHRTARWPRKKNRGKAGCRVQTNAGVRGRTVNHAKKYHTQ